MDVLNVGLRSPFAKPMRSPFAPGAQTPTQRAIAVLRRFGPDAHVYLPGVGMLNGLQAGNYLDSAGTTQGTVDQPVGLVLDAGGGLGVELVTNGDFSAGAAGWTISGGGTLPTISAGQLVFAQTDGQYSFCRRDLNSALVAGKTYMVSVACTAYTGGTAQIVLLGGTVAATTIPVGINAFSFMFVAVSANTGVEVSRTASSTLVASFDNISVREVTGIHAQQPTPSAKPILRRDAGGRYYWQFDGSNDSLSLGGPLFQMADDHCVVAGGLSTLATGDRYFLDHGSSASSSPMVASLALAGTLAKVYWRDDANVTTAINGGFVAQGSVAILSARKVSTTGVLRVNGQQVASAAIAAGATTLTGAAIGTRVSPANMLAGQVYPVIAIKGTVTDPDLLLLEKLVGQMAGVTI